MTLEKQGERVLFEGQPVNRGTFNQVCKQYFTAESLEKLWRDLDTCGRVHIALVFVNESNRLRNKLERANKKIAALENYITRRQLEQIYSDL